MQSSRAFLSCLATTAFGVAGVSSQVTFPMPATTASRQQLEQTAPFLLPRGVAQTRLVDRVTLTARGLPSRFANWDMVTFGPASRYVFVPTEVDGGAGVFRYDTTTGAFTVLMQGNRTGIRNANPATFNPTHDDFVDLDPATWTPWGTVVTGEETAGGRLFEILNPLGSTPFQVAWRAKIPAVEHEGLRFDSAGTLYFVDESDSGSLYKFVPLTPGNLSNGQTFALSVDAYAATPGIEPTLGWSHAANRSATRTGAARWVPITDPYGTPLTRANPFAFVTATGGREAADEVRATPFGRPEDLAVGRLASGNEVIYVTATAENRVYSLELLDATLVTVRVFVDYDTINLATGLDVNPLQNDPFTDPGPDGDTNFDDPDNLAIDAFGSIYVVEDEDPGDIWKAFDADRDGVAEAIGMLASLGVGGSEPTGLIADPNDPYRFLVSVMHPASGNDTLWLLDTNPYRGPGDDLRAATGINAAPTFGPGEFVRRADTGLLVSLTLDSPAGGLAGVPATLLLQVIPTAGGPSTTLANVWLDPSQPMLAVPGGAPLLPAAGFSLTTRMPRGLTGFSVILQGVAVAGGQLAWSHAHEIVVR